MKEDIHYLPYPDPGESSAPFGVMMAGTSYCDGSYRIARKNSNVTVVEYIIAGTGTVNCNGRVYTASAGDVYILRHGSRHMYRSDAQNPWTKIWFNVYGPLADGILSAYGLDGKVVFGGCGDSILPLFRRFCRTVEENLEAREIFRRCAILFHEIISRLAGLQDRAKIGRQNEAYAIKSRLDSHIEGRITLRSLAASIYRSEAYTIEVFKNEFGKTPYRYLLERKIETAKNLLGNSVLPVKEISMMLGYEDQHYFSGLFRQFTGVPPKEYRKLLLGEPPRGRDS